MIAIFTHLANLNNLNNVIILKREFFIPAYIYILYHPITSGGSKPPTSGGLKSQQPWIPRASPVQLNSNQPGKKHISLNNIPIDDSEYDSERFGIERPNLFDKANNYYQ